MSIGAGKLGPLMRKAKREGWDGWVRSPADERAVRNGCVFDLAAAEHVRDFFRMFLRHSKGKWAGLPFELQDWQFDDVVAPIFGWMRADGTRRIRDADCWVSKKNGKSTMAAGVGNYLLIGDGESGAEVYSAATKRDQAAIVHKEAISMVKKSPELRCRLRINESTGRITYDATGSFYGVLASEAGGAEGLNIHGLIADELHVWKGRAFWDSLRHGGVARRQPLRFTISTVGILDRSSLGWDQYGYAMRWLEDRVENDEFYAYIRAADEKDDPYDPATHAKANPSYGVIIDPQEMVKAAQVARDRPTEKAAFLRYRLNLWVEAMDAFFDMAKWDACDGAVNEDELLGRECFGGLDLASKKDLAAWVLLFTPTDEDPVYRVLARCWCPRGGAEQRSEADGVPYVEWERQGWLTLTDGDRIDYRVIRDQIVADVNRFGITDVGADPWNLEYLRQEVLDDIGAVTFYEFSQQLRTISGPTKELEKIVAEKRLAHGGHPVLRWCAANSQADEDKLENVRISKRKSSDKVDLIIALVMALGRSMTAEPEEEEVTITEINW